jgi:hypothetical protein
MSEWIKSEIVANFVESRFHRRLDVEAVFTFRWTLDVEISI